MRNVRGSGGHRELLRVIRSVRRRWRTRVLLQGAAIVLTAGFAIFLLSTFGIDRLRFDETAVVLFRIIAYLGLAGLTIHFILRPLLRRASDEQVALYLEEHEPTSRAAILSAVEAGYSEGAGTGTSAALTRRLIEDAVRQCREMEGGRRIERRRLGRASAWLLGVATVIALVTLLGPGFIGSAGPLILRPWTDADATSPYSISVEPGDALVARGADQKVTALTRGFQAGEVEIAVKRGQVTTWERFRMTSEPETGGFEILLFGLEEATEYLVEAEGVRSEIYRIEVADLPYVDRIDMEYRFPSYTGLSPRTVEDGGDIAAIRGTRVLLRIAPTFPVPSGRITISGVDDAPPIELSVVEGGFEAEIVVERELFYRVELEAPTGDLVPASPDYLVEPLDDQPPVVTITEPGRDTRVNAIEEVFAEVEAEDDFGVGTLELSYSVNGGPDEVVLLYGTREGGHREVTRGHTFFLEELELQPGDVVSYYARASDLNRVGGTRATLTDLYFLEIRPYGQNYRQADQAPGGGGGGAALGGALSQQQRQIVAATFNMMRDGEEYERGELGENLATLALLQGRLREQVETLVQQMVSRGLAATPEFQKVAEELPLAAEAMMEAEERLGERRPSDALPPEQRALQHLQRAEAAFRDVQVSQQQGVGGGGGGSPQAEELADLFELELDKLRNQYESVQRGERQQRDAEVDEALQRLQELARRQQQLNERARAQRGETGSGGGAQNRLVDETEELARQLERLAREDDRPELRDSARRLREAADAMRRAAARGESEEARGSEALQRLSEARRLLENRQTSALARDVDEALRRAERIVERQRGIEEDVADLDGAATDPATAGQLRDLSDRKDALAEDVAGLETDLDRMAREMRREQRDASRELQRAATSVRENKLKEKILYSKGVMGQRSEEYARSFEAEIRQNTEELRDAIAEARRAFGEADPRRLDQRLEEARNLVRGLESLRERVRQRGQEGQEGEGQQGEGQGQQGEGQQGEGQGQQGQDRQGGGAAGAPGGGGPGGFTPGDLRQFQREFQQRASEADRLRRALEADGIDAGELQDVIARLRELDDLRVYDDLAEFERLQEEILRDLKDFEFALRRELLGTEIEKLFLSGSDDVPEEYRALVEEYYRLLSEDGPDPPP